VEHGNGLLDIYLYSGMYRELVAQYGSTDTIHLLVENACSVEEELVPLTLPHTLHLAAPEILDASYTGSGMPMQGGYVDVSVKDTDGDLEWIGVKRLTQVCQPYVYTMGAGSTPASCPGQWVTEEEELASLDLLSRGLPMGGY